MRFSQSKPSRPLVDVPGEVHVQQDQVEALTSQQVGQPPRVSLGAYVSHVPADQQLGGEEDILVVVDDENPAGFELALLHPLRAAWLEVSVSGQSL